MAPMSAVDLIHFAKRDSLTEDQLQTPQNSSMNSSDVDNSRPLTTLGGTVFIGLVVFILVLLLYVM